MESARGLCEGGPLVTPRGGDLHCLEDRLSAFLANSGDLPTEKTGATSPERQGLYNPANEHDSCGVGFVVNFKGAKSHTLVEQGLRVLENLEHRGAVGADELAGGRFPAF